MASSPWTLEDIERNLALWRTCSEKVAQGFSFAIGDVTYTRTNAAQIPKMIELWEKRRRRYFHGNRPRFRRVSW